MEKIYRVKLNSNGMPNFSTAVEVADRPQGEWIDGKCSLCGKHAPYWAMATTYYKSNYCPNCGARMKGADDEV